MNEDRLSRPSESAMSAMSPAELRTAAAKLAAARTA